jgi:hypothetical protein
MKNVVRVVYRCMRVLVEYKTFEIAAMVACSRSVASHQGFFTCRFHLSAHTEQENENHVTTTNNQKGATYVVATGGVGPALAKGPVEPPKSKGMSDDVVKGAVVVKAIGGAAMVVRGSIS